MSLPGKEQEVNRLGSTPGLTTTTIIHHNGWLLAIKVTRFKWQPVSYYAQNVSQNSFANAPGR